MESVGRARQRFRQYPLIFAQCGKEASLYATCVLKQDNIKQHDCGEEFRGFKTCLNKAAANLKTRV